MAYTTEQLNNLENAIAAGALSVRFNDRTIQYNTTDEMLRLRNLIRAELGVPVPANSRCRFITLPTGKGL